MLEIKKKKTVTVSIQGSFCKRKHVLFPGEVFCLFVCLGIDILASLICMAEISLKFYFKQEGDY